MKPEQVLEIVEKHQGKLGGVMAILEGVQAEIGYLPEEAIRLVAEKTGQPLVDVYGVATFYGSLRLKPRGRHLISACLGTACHVRGASLVVEMLKTQLGIDAGETTSDREFTLETVNCLGACALGPVVVIDGHYFPNMNPAKISGLLARVCEGLDKVDIDTDERLFPLEVSCSCCGHSLMDAQHLVDGHPSIGIIGYSANERGWIRLSSLYGSHNVESEAQVPDNTLTRFFCPHCNRELVAVSICGDCGAPMVAMAVDGGGIVQICARRGCKGHILDLAQDAF